MDVLKDHPRKLFLRYLAASLGGCMIMTVYGLVDTLAIGHYEGPDGAAAIAAVMPMWTIMFSVGLLLGIGGSVLMAQHRGAGKREEGDCYFTAALFTGILAAALLTLVFLLFLNPLLFLFGGRGHVLELASAYSRWIARVLPAFTLMQVIAPFIRNDGHPGYATFCTMAGGCFNIFGDIYFVFVCDMGIRGAGLATALGQLLAISLLAAYFLKKDCSLRLRFMATGDFVKRLGRILTMGAGNFVVDLAMGILAVLFNNQIIALMSTDALAVYGVVSNLATIVQTFGYAAGESAQAIMSPNFGAGHQNRVRTVFRYGMLTAALMGLMGLLLAVIAPKAIVGLYMKAEPGVLALAPGILRRYAPAFAYPKCMQHLLFPVGRKACSFPGCVPSAGRSADRGDDFSSSCSVRPIGPLAVGPGG